MKILANKTMKKNIFKIHFITLISMEKDMIYDYENEVFCDMLAHIIQH